MPDFEAPTVGCVFVRLPMPVAVGQRVQLDAPWGAGVVDTCKVADDLRDAKCTVLLDVPARREALRDA